MTTKKKPRSREKTTVRLFGKKIPLEKKQKIRGVTFELVGGENGYFIRGGAKYSPRGLGFLFGTRGCRTPALAAFEAETLLRCIRNALERLVCRRRAVAVKR